MRKPSLFKKNDLVLLLTTFARFDEMRDNLFIGTYPPLGGQIILDGVPIIVTVIKVSLIKKDNNNFIRLNFGSEKIDLVLKEETIQIMDNAYIIITKDDIINAMTRVGIIPKKVMVDLDLI